MQLKQIRCGVNRFQTFQLLFGLFELRVETYSQRYHEKEYTGEDGAYNYHVCLTQRNIRILNAAVGLLVAVLAFAKGVMRGHNATFAMEPMTVDCVANVITEALVVASVLIAAKAFIVADCVFAIGHASEILAHIKETLVNVFADLLARVTIVDVARAYGRVAKLAGAGEVDRVHHVAVGLHVAVGVVALARIEQFPMVGQLVEGIALDEHIWRHQIVIVGVTIVVVVGSAVAATAAATAAAASNQ